MNRPLMSLTNRFGELAHGGACWLLLCTCCAALGADTVTVRSANGRRESKLSGEIVDGVGAELTLRRASGRDERIATDRIVDVESNWSESQQRAEQLREEGKCTEALIYYRQALDAEQRTWVRRRIVARLIECYADTGEYERAGDMFAVLISSDPQTPDFAVIPLNWGTARPNASLESRAMQWLDAGPPPLRLLGASWLLGSRRGDAVAALHKLSSDSDSRVAFLAKAQLWRSNAATAQKSDVAQWEDVVERMPESLRAGPHYVVAEVLARHNEHQAAALHWLRIPVLYAHQRQLAAEALWRAANQLERLGKTAEARTLYREIVSQHPHAACASQARERLAPVKDGAASPAENQQQD